VKTLLLKHADIVVTMDGDAREIADGGVYIVGPEIRAVGPTAILPQTADEVIDLTGHIVCPGLINTHHHMFQSLTRAARGAQDSSLFGWLKVLLPIWSKITPDMVRTATQTAMAELLLSGCTTSSDHLYLYPNGCRLDDSIDGAAEIGMRFHAARGSMSIGESAGGLPPDYLVEREDAIERDTQRLIETFHDAARFAMRRIVVAPCSPFTVSEAMMRNAAVMARHYGVSLHTHLAENDEDVDYTWERFRKTPAQYVEDLGWTGPDVWHAHCVKLDDHGIGLFGATHTGIAHCPCSNMRLGSGIAPIGQMRGAGVKIGLGVDGSSSNDSGNLLNEARQALLLQRVARGADAMSARTALELATRGGASVLNRDDIGSLAPGMAADLAVFDLSSLAFAGALDDPVAALVLCGSVPASYTIVNGRVVVSKGAVTTLDLGALVRRHNQYSTQLLSR
jgi:cytosine/adenosine deaminase-related metal-dependent hydrolase